MKLPVIISLISFALSVPAQAQNLYRYVNTEGVPVITTNLPSSGIDSGYEIIDKHGRVLKVIAPKLSDEKRAALKQEEDKLRKLQARRERDRELLQLYSSPDEARNEMERRIAEIKVQIELLDGTAHRVQKSLDKKKTHADKVRAAGRELTPQLTGEISAAKASVDKINNERQKLDDDIAATRKAFGHDIERLKLLLKSRGTYSQDRNSTIFSEELFLGDWRNREDLWLDWNLEEGGKATITKQILGTAKRSKSTGSWKLEGNQIVFLLNQRKTTDSRGSTRDLRVSEEQKAMILEADRNKLMVLLNGSLITLTRP